MILNPDGTCELETIHNAGRKCQAIADRMAQAVGATPDESTRRNTVDYQLQPKQTGSQHIDVR